MSNFHLLHQITCSSSNRPTNYPACLAPLLTSFNTQTKSLNLAPVNEQVFKYEIMGNSISISRALESML